MFLAVTLRFPWFETGRPCGTTTDITRAEMKYIIAALYSNFSTSVVDDTGIEQSDAYTAPPKSDTLLIRLSKLAA